jgi:hypothetical protein
VGVLVGVLSIDNSRHPPRWGGTPPRPLTRIAIAMIPVADSAISARRSNFTGPS